MAVRMAEHVAGSFGQLRVEPTPVRLRAALDGVPALDTTEALLVWEPGRVVPQYAVPAADVVAELLPGGDGPRHGPGAQPLGPDGRSVLTPDTGFGVHSSDGEPLTIRLGGTERVGAAFRPADPELAGYVFVDFTALDWTEEDEPVVGHPRDPFHRVDARRSSRHVRIALDGQVLAESRRPVLVTETWLPVRWYLPPEDVRTGLLTPSATVTECAYKGVARYDAAGGRDIAWRYPEPLPGSEALAGLVSFFTEHVDVRLDGVDVTRPVSPWT